MRKKVIVSGLLGGVVLIVWTFVVNGFFGFKNNMDMKPIPDERQVYETLKESIIEPGRYICNPELSSSGSFPDGEPVFSIHYSGMGHESAGRLALVELGLFLLAPMIGAWMLSATSGTMLSSYPKKVLFFTAIGLLVAAYGALGNLGIESYPLNDTLILAVHDIAAWTVVGLVVAWRIRPEAGMVTPAQSVRVSSHQGDAEKERGGMS